MSNGDLLHTIQNAVDEGDSIPPKVTNRLILAGVIELYNKFEDVEKLRGEVAAIRKCHHDYPSLTWLIVHKPKSTIFCVVLVLTIIIALQPLFEKLFM